MNPVWRDLTLPCKSRMIRRFQDKERPLMNVRPKLESCQVVRRGIGSLSRNGYSGSEEGTEGRWASTSLLLEANQTHQVDQDESQQCQSQKDSASDDSNSVICRKDVNVLLSTSSFHLRISSLCLKTSNPFSTHKSWLCRKDSQVHSNHHEVLVTRLVVKCKKWLESSGHWLKLVEVEAWVELEGKLKRSSKLRVQLSLKRSSLEASVEEEEKEMLPELGLRRRGERRGRRRTQKELCPFLCKFFGTEAVF